MMIPCLWMDKLIVIWGRLCLTTTGFISGLTAMFKGQDGETTGHFSVCLGLMCFFAVLLRRLTENC
ncbi:hypothetical protein QBC40DRAFT_67057 [Triangularia verruculosa]|uniref:Uncharacterized protein n=1 Tax=Triangularia verruculosa TaxID=2587418 RepID=A0AAN6XJQ9_9PEZI|nr:hypothetical protein QBC40DRAFT_67057 [Triangularia verruculosa]